MTDNVSLEIEATTLTTRELADLADKRLIDEAVLIGATIVRSCPRRTGRRPNRC